jgi:cyclopropane-fatty-acyl-phospholipid synthase
MADRYRTTVEGLLQKADVKIGGDRPWDLQVNNERLYRRIMTDGTIGAGESYMDGWWDSPDLEQLITHILQTDFESAFGGKLRLAALSARARLANLQTVSRSYSNVHRHYDIGNDLYELMLGRTMAYSCGYWAEAKTLDSAQEAKLDLVCRKLGLKKGMTLLDVGCGWGSLVKYAAEHYGAECVGITLSQEQARYAREATKGLPVKILVQDYREFSAKPFDRIASIGMFEHVGPHNYRKFMTTSERLLRDDGIMLLHTIGGNYTTIGGDPWIDRYIFPGGVIPSVAGIGKAIEKIFVMEDWHNFGPDYAKTLRAWWRNFEKSYPTLDQKHYDKRFYRMWKFYLLACAANFAIRNLQLWQIVLTKPGAHSGYRSVR